ncbi:MAG: hypothetical protein AB7H77_03720 [Bdellovibrionales bacterium]
MTEPVMLALGGMPFELKPGYAAVTALEESFNRPLLAIAEIFIDGDATLKSMTAALAVILALPPGPALGEDIVAAGIGRVLEALQKFFLLALGSSSLVGKTDAPDRENEWPQNR